MRVSRAALLAVAVVTMAFGSATVIAGCGGGSSASKGAQSAKNPCGGNPCAGNPCGGNPCGANPCGNPCGGNPCGGASITPETVTQPKGQALNTGGLSETDLLAKGNTLWNDKKLSASGTLACSTCHNNGMMFNPTFKAAYPHGVKMVKEKSGMDSVNAAEMVQFCMLAPMKSKVFAWDSVDLAALTAKVNAEQKAYQAK